MSWSPRSSMIFRARRSVLQTTQKVSFLFKPGKKSCASCLAVDKPTAVGDSCLQPSMNSIRRVYTPDTVCKLACYLKKINFNLISWQLQPQANKFLTIINKTFLFLFFLHFLKKHATPGATFNFHWNDITIWLYDVTIPHIDGGQIKDSQTCHH